MSDPKAFNCPSCGAPLSTKGAEREVTCQFCGTHVLVPEPAYTKQEPPVVPHITVQPQVVVVTPNIEPRVTVYRSSSRGCSGVIATLTLIIAAVAYTLLKNPTIASQFTGAVGAISASSGNILGAGALVSGTEGDGPGQFQIVRHFALDGSGNVFVADMKTFRIQKFDASGKYITNWTVDQGKAEYGPDALAADKDGNVYAVEDGAILKYDGNGNKLLWKFKGDGDQIYDIAFAPDGVLWAVSSRNFQADLVRVDVNGKLLGRVSNPIAPQMDTSGYAAWEIELAIDKTGNIFALVGDSFHPKVLEFSPDGKNLLAKFGDGGDAPGKFSTPRDIAVDDQDHVYIAEQTRVQVLDNQGRFLKNLVTSRSLAAMALLYDGKGSLYTLGYNAIFKRDIGSTATTSQN